jgi:DNA-binding transcriptional LysR family regulator
VDAGLNLFRLELFAAVVDRGGYSAAATHLGLAQPSVSFHMKALERIVGAKLLTYRGRTVQLTPEGEEVYRAAKLIVSDTENLLHTIELIRGGQRGRLRLGASIAFEQGFFFKRVLAPFLHAHPAVHVSLHFGRTEQLAEGVLSRELDLAYLLNSRLPADIAYEPLHRAELVFLASPEHPLSSREHVTAEDINQAGIITLPDVMVETTAFASVFRTAGLRETHVALEVDGVQARMLAVHAGLGVLTMFIPPYADESAYNGLCPLRIDVPPSMVEFGIASRAGYPWTPVMQEFVRCLREEAGLVDQPVGSAVAAGACL